MKLSENLVNNGLYRHSKNSFDKIEWERDVHLILWSHNENKNTDST